MAITGHRTSKEVTRYTKGAQRRVLAANGMARQQFHLGADAPKVSHRDQKPIETNDNFFGMVPGGGIEPPTLRFSVACSTN